MPFCEGVTRAALEILFEMVCLFDCLKCYIQFYFPGTEFGCVRTFLGIVISEPLSEVGGMPNVTLVGMPQAFDHVCVEHGLPSVAWNLIREKSSFAKAMEDIQRLKPSRCSDSKRRMVESVGNAPTSACLQGKCIACLPRPWKEFQSGTPPWCCPTRAEFWRLCCAAGARRMKSGAAGGNCTHTCSVAGSHSAVNSQPRN